MELDDEGLMLRICEGDTVAYRTLVERHIHRMVRLAQGMVGERSDAEDIVQEAFLRVWIHAKSWDAAKAKFNSKKANALILPTYHNGFDFPKV